MLRCVITLFCRVHSLAGTPHSAAAAAISISRAVAPPLRTYSCDSRMPRLPPVEKLPHTRSRARFCAGRRIFGRDLGPVALQLLGDELGEAGQRPLPHLGAGDADDHRIVGLDHHPGIDLRRRLAALGACRLDERHVEAERQAAGRGGDADEEAAAGEARLWRS